MGNSRELTIRQENFCLAYVETGCAAEAYRQAFNAKNYNPNSLYVKASHLLHRDKIGLRIATLKARQLQRHDTTVDSLTNELDELLRLTRKSGKCSAAIKAIMYKARLHGLDRQQNQVAVRYESTPQERKVILQNLLIRTASQNNTTPLA